MRALQYKFGGLITGEYQWTPVFLQIGSNLHGKRFQKGSVLFEHSELENALVEPDKLKQWLTLLHLHYYEPSSLT